MAHWRCSNRMIIKLDRYLTRKKFNGIDFESKLSERCWESRGRANNRPPTFSVVGTTQPVVIKDTADEGGDANADTGN